MEEPTGRGKQHEKQQIFASEMFTCLSFILSQPQLVALQQPDAPAPVVAALVKLVTGYAGNPVAARVGGGLVGATMTLSGAVASSSSTGETPVLGNLAFPTPQVGFLRGGV